MTLQQFLLIINARRQLIVITLLGTVAIVLVLSLVWPKSYTATTAVVLDQKPDPMSNLTMSGLQSLTYLSTQIEIIQSERVAGKVVRYLNLLEDPEVIREWRADTDGRGDMAVWLSRLLLKKLDAKPQSGSNVVDISYTAREPKLAAIIANHFAQAYIDTSLELKVEPARQYASWFIERTESMRSSLEKAQAQLSQGQREKGIVSVDERLDVENARLADLSAQLTVLQAQSADSNSRQTAAKGDKNILPEVLQSTLVQTLKADVARTEAKLDQLAGQLGRNHPQYKRGEMELRSLQHKLEKETAQVASGIGTSNRVNVQREADIKAALEAQKVKVLQLKRQRDEIAVMQRDVESAQRSYDLVLQRLNQSNMESQVNQTNVVVLHPATEPFEPSRPRLVLNLLVSVFVGLLLGIGLALRREILDCRIRLAGDVTELLQIPLLGVVEKSIFGADRSQKHLRAWWRLGATAKA